MGLLCVLGVPAVRPHQRRGDGRRPPEVGEGRPADDQGGAGCADHGVPRARPQRLEDPRLPRRGAEAHPGRPPLVDVRSPGEYSGQRSTCRTIRTKARCAAATSGREERPVGQGRQPGRRDVQDGRALHRSTTRSRASKRRHIIAYCRIGERSSHTWFVLTYLLGYPKVRNYDGSWTEWGNLVGVPIER